MTDTRYGIFLRPDARTCWSVTQITLALKQQFGLVSASAFPPHATLVGNLHTDARPEDLIAALNQVFAATGPVTVHNAGIHRNTADTFEYNVNLDEGHSGPNLPLRDLAEAVRQAVLPLSIPVADRFVTPVEEYQFAGHLGLASHDLFMQPRLADEVGNFIEEIAITAPPAFEARWFSLFAFQADWSNNWWEQMTWQHLHSWDVVSRPDTLPSAA